MTAVTTETLPSAPALSAQQSLLSAIMFHQAYHSGQLGVLRRVVGKEGRSGS